MHTLFSYRAKTDKWIFLFSGSNITILWVDEPNIVFFQKSCLKGLKWSFSKMLTLIFICGVILYLGKRLFEPLEITFLKKTFYFAYLLTKEKNWATQKQNSFVSFHSVWNGCGRPVWPHPFSKFENKHITSFLEPFPGSVTHFTSFEGIEGEGVIAP